MTSIEKIIAENCLSAVLQPVISVKTRSLIGFEALSRAADPFDGTPIPPAELFSRAAEEGMTLELDRACRKTILSAFSPIHRDNAALMLFMNFESSIIDMGAVGSGHIVRSAEDAGVSPCNIIIEIVESKVSDIGAMRFFIETQRSHGFLIALDDVGAGHSNLDRIPIVRPDIIKVDRSLITGIDREYYNRKIVEALRLLSRGTGSLLLAEGVETEDEAAVSCELGADLFQGYFFSRPVKPEDAVSDYSRTIERVSEKCRRRMTQSFLCRGESDAQCRSSLGEIVSSLTASPLTAMSDVLRTGLISLAGCECIYLLDVRGVQTGPTVCSEHMKRNVSRSPLLFHPAEDGADHSLKDYYSVLTELSVSAYTTDPYISLATGSVCRTFSIRFTHAGGEEYILCADISSSE